MTQLTTITALRTPGLKGVSAAPGIPEHIRAIAKLMLGEFRWMVHRGKYVLTISRNKTDHHFEADPKLLCTDDLWLKLLGEVADFLAERGFDATDIKLKMQDYIGIYTSTDYDQVQQEQNRTASGIDAGDGPQRSARGARAAGEPVPAGVPDSPASAAAFAWPTESSADRPSTSASDADEARSGGGKA